MSHSLHRYTCQLFLCQIRKIFLSLWLGFPATCEVFRRFPEEFRTLPKISEDVPTISELFRSWLEFVSSPQMRNGVATKRGVGHGLGHGVGHGVGHGLSYGLQVVNFIKQFTLECLKILIIIKHKCEGIAPIKAKIQIRYILALKHKSEPCIWLLFVWELD